MGTFRQHQDIFWGMIITALMFIIFPVLMDAVGEIVGWTGDGTGNITDFTGLNSVLPIAPLIIFVAMMFGSLGLTGYGAVRVTKEGKINIAIVMSIIMIAVGFLFYEIVLDGAQTLLNDANIASYTGLEAVVGIAPMLVLITYVFGALGTAGYATYTKIKSKSKSKKKA